MPIKAGIYDATHIIMILPLRYDTMTVLDTPNEFDTT